MLEQIVSDLLFRPEGASAPDYIWNWYAFGLLIALFIAWRNAILFRYILTIPIAIVGVFLVLFFMFRIGLISRAPALWDAVGLTFGAGLLVQVLAELLQPLIQLLSYLAGRASRGHDEE